MKNLDLKTIAIVVLIIVLMAGGGFWFNDHNKQQAKYNLEVNLKNALQDSIEYYQNKEGEWVAEKKTLQADISTLEDKNLNLTENQKELVRRIKNLSNKNDVIVAALARQEAVIDSLMQIATSIDTVKNTITFVKVTDTLEYDIKILNVKPLKSKVLQPTMFIKKLKIPNELFVEFHWEDGKTHPIAVSISNSNPLFKTNDIDSYAIPELQKDVVKPTGWQKIGNFFKKTGKYIGIFGAGAIVGGLVIAGSG